MRRAAPPRAAPRTREARDVAAVPRVAL